MIHNTCALVGHRSNQLPGGCDENNYLCCRLKKILKQEIKKMIKQGVSTFYVGGQDGIDLIAAEMILELKTRYPAIRMSIVLAYEGMTQDWTEDTW